MTVDIEIQYKSNSGIFNLKIEQCDDIEVIWEEIEDEYVLINGKVDADFDIKEQIESIEVVSIDEGDEDLAQECADESLDMLHEYINLDPDSMIGFHILTKELGRNLEESFQKCGSLYTISEEDAEKETIEYFKDTDQINSNYLIGKIDWDEVIEDLCDDGTWYFSKNHNLYVTNYHNL